MPRSKNATQKNAPSSWIVVISINSSARLTTNPLILNTLAMLTSPLVIGFAKNIVKEINDASITAIAIPIVSYQSYLEKINSILIPKAIKSILIMGSPRDSKKILKKVFFFNFVSFRY